MNRTPPVDAEQLSGQFQAQVLDEISEPVVAIALDGEIAYLNRATALFRLPESVVVGANVFDLPAVPVRWTEEIRTAMAATCAKGSHRAEYSITTRNETHLTIVCTFRLYHDAVGDPAGVVMIGLDATELIAGREMLLRRSRQSQLIAQLSTDALGRNDFVALCQRAAEALAEVVPAGEAAVGELDGKEYVQLASRGADMFPADAVVDLSPFAVEVGRLSRGEPVVVDLSTFEEVPLGCPRSGVIAVVSIPFGERLGLVSTYHASASGETVATEVDFLHAVANVLAAAAGREHFESRLRRQAFHDDLTGLPNRRHLLRLASRAREEHSHAIAMMICDLDRFGTVNEALGHARGDQLLLGVAERLQSAVRAGDTVARVGGDTFAVLCANAGPDEAIEVAEHIVAALATGFSIAGNMMYVTASVGVAVPANGENALDLLRNAENALHEAKRLGGGRPAMFDDVLFARAVERLALSVELPTAIAEGELRLLYQPQVDLRTGAICGAEALLRWQHPRRGLLTPDQFLGIAEESGLMRRLGDWVTESALRDLRTWSHRRSGRGVDVAINLSASELTDASLVASISRHLSAFGVDPSLVTFEITETAAMRDPVAAVDALNRLRALGVHIAVDDFGTGYASMAYLRRLPLDSLKIDREFTAGVTDMGDDEAIVRATIGLAGELNLKSVAEGVETQEQATALAALGCDRGQGWLYAKAMPLDELMAFIDNHGVLSRRVRPLRVRGRVRARETADGRRSAGRASR